jgi:hypothetical protein
MDTQFLLQNRDEQVLDNYLKLLAFTAQNTISDHAWMALKIENAQLQQQLQQERAKNAALLNKRLDELLNSENADVQAEVKARIQHYVVTKTTSEVKSLFKSGVGKMSAMLEEKRK